MSETDDTEALLLIPPSLFLISSSDSEKSLEKLPKKSRQHFFVESLANEIGSIQLRLENLESLSFSEQASYSDLVFRENQKKSTSSCFITPTKQYHNESNVNNYHTFPKRSTQNHSTISLKKTYSNTISRPLRKLQEEDSCRVFKSSPNDQYNTNAVVNLETKFSISSFDSESTNGGPEFFYCSSETVNMDSGTENAVSPSKRRDNSMLCEIDAFLDGIKKIENNLYGEKEQEWIAPVQIRRTENESRFNKDLATSNTADYLSKFIYLPDYGQDLNSSKKEMAVEKSFNEQTKFPISQYKMSDVYSSLNSQHEHEMKESFQPINNLQNVNNTISNNLSSVRFSKNSSNEDSFLENQAKTIQTNKPDIKSNKQIPDYNYPIDLSNNIKSTLKSHSDQEYIQQSKIDCHPSERSCTIIESQTRNLQGAPVNNFCGESYSNLLPNHMNNVAANRKDESVDSTFVGNRQFVLPRLSEMWGSSSNKNFKTSSSDIHNFEEEKLRRQHCETVIQQLQKKLLEQQQRLAVALQVDAAKEEAIRKLRDACAEISNQVNDVEEELNNKISKMDMQLRETSEENKELKETNTRNNMEISSAVQLARNMKEDFKVKLLEIEKELEESQNDVSKFKDILKNKDERLSELKESNALVVNLNGQISDNLKRLQTNFDKERQDHCKTKDVLNEMIKNREHLDDEINILKSEKNNLRLVIAEEKSRNTHLDGQKSRLQTSLEVVNKKFKSLGAEFEIFKNQSEIQNNELKTSYQKQLETIILSKHNEFKQQLDLAEALKENELQNREKNMALQFAKQLHRAEEQHQMEIAIFEDKHKEEIKLCRVQLARSSQIIQQLEDNISSYKNRRGQIAAQLHSVMENQWHQALQIITNGAENNQHGYPGVTDQQPSTRHNDRPFDHRQQSTNNMMMANNGYQPPSTQCFYNEHVNNAQNLNTNERTPSKCQNHNFFHANRNENAQTDLTENGLQHYIKLLLQKPPGLIDLPKEDCATEGKFVTAIKNDSRSPAKNSDDEYPTRDRNNEGAERKLDRHGNLKKPWK